MPTDRVGIVRCDRPLIAAYSFGPPLNDFYQHRLVGYLVSLTPSWELLHWANNQHLEYGALFLRKTKGQSGWMDTHSPPILTHLGHHWTFSTITRFIPVVSGFPALFKVFSVTYSWEELHCAYKQHLGYGSLFMPKTKGQSGCLDANSLPTLTRWGHHWTVSTTTHYIQWFSLTILEQKVALAGRNCYWWLTLVNVGGL